MTERRPVVALPQFFDRLDELLPTERSASGRPSSTDFLLHELPAIIDALAENYEASTMPVPGIEDRVLVTGGLTVEYVAVYVGLEGRTVQLYWVDIEPQ